MVALFLILVVALGLRLISLNQSFWLDEAVQAITSAGPLSGIWGELIGDFHPPLYHLFMWGWVRLFGNSEIILRLPSVLFGVGTPFAIYKIAMELGIRKQDSGKITPTPLSSTPYPILSMVLAATSPYLIYYSQEARMYSMATFLATLSSYLFVKVVQAIVTKNSNDKIQIHKSNSKFKIPTMKEIFVLTRQNLITNCYLLFTLLLVYTDYYGWLVVLAQFVLLVILKKWRFIVLSSLFLILSYLPWLKMLITQYKAGITMTQSLPAWSSLVNLNTLKAIPLTLVKFTLGRISFPDKQLYLFIVLIVAVVYLLVMYLGIRGWLKNRKTPNSQYNNILIYYSLLWFIAPLLISWLVSFRVPNFQPFRLLLIVPAFCLLVGLMIEFASHHANTLMIRIIIVFLLVVNFLSLSAYYTQPYLRREDWRGLVKYTDANQASLLIPSESSNWPVRYYSDGQTKLIYGGTGANQVDIPPDINGGTVYYLRYLVPVFDPTEKLLNQLRALGYNKVDTISFNQLEIWHYAKFK